VNGVPHHRVIGGGDRPWLVVVHGMALDHREFLGFAETLAAYWRVLLWDMPGHGASQPQPADYGIAAMTDALEAVLAANAIDRLALLGFSYGGIVAQEFARRHPGRLDAVILHGCFMAYLQPPPLPGWAVGPLIDVMYAFKGWPRAQADFIAACAMTKAGRAVIADAPAALGKPGFVAMTKALLRANRPDPGFAIAAPLLLVRGEHDRYAKAIDAGFDALSATSPQARRQVIAGAGHCAHLDAPAAFHAVVAAFVAPLSGGAAAIRAAAG
jgi:pimeloyl-ACP methyl ester carboxylesterase